MRSTGTSIDGALSRADATLLEDLRQLEEAIRPASGERLAELRTRLGATRVHIAEHFRFEEENGFMEAVRKREPRLERAIQQLAGDHRQLTKSLDAVIKEAEAATNPNDTLRNAVREWLEHVRQHEIRENDVVQDAFNFDIAAED